MIDRSTSPSVIFWLVLLSALAFFSTKEQWYYHWSPEAQMSFWVAVGTLALAGTTLASVYYTGKVLRAEDRRHRQGLAPIVTVEPEHLDNRRSVTGFLALNRGLGPALNVHLTARIKYEIPIHTRGPDDVHTRLLRNDILVVDVNSRLSVVATQGTEFDVFRQPGMGEQSYSVWPSAFENVCLSYTDMFGNVYSTIYTDYSAGLFEWKRPFNLL